MDNNSADLGETDAILVTDQDGTIISINEELEKSVNCPLKNLKGQNAEDVFGTDLSGISKKTAMVHLGDSRYKLYLKQVGKIKPYPLKNISSYFGQILDSIYEGVVIVDSNRTILYANQKASEMTGVKLRPKNMLVYYAEEFSDISVIDIVMKTNKPFTAISTFKNGVTALTTGIPVFDKTSKKLKFAVTVVRSITELITKKKSIDHQTQKPLAFPVKKFLSNSKRMKYVINKIDNLATPHLPILFTGETGTGKDYFAKILHDYIYHDSTKHPFIRVNCGAIPESLLESELFGYDKGAFTGASDKGKKGMLELAENGTLFLDEIGELPYLMQSKLLGVLQDREMIRVGGQKKIKITAKIVFATNADLTQMIEEKKFRSDLFYRLSLITIKMPPLRDRIEDIPNLLETILREINQKHRKNSYLSLELLNVFLQYSWPGNIRELRNITEKLVVFADNERVEIDDLLAIGNFLGGDSETQLLMLASKSRKKDNKTGLKDWVHNYERTMIQNVLKSAGTLKEAAGIMNIDISTLVRKKKKYSI